MVTGLASINDQAFGEEVVEEVVKHADRSAFVVYIPYQELVIKRRDYSFFVV